ncbi:hypothetical protein D8B26_006839 [Coccidioides posadasii str. Silveira]|uniref:Aldo-keto reductase n=2 Tax=Coccidioides posadasii TaxID=199306 RepID=E9CS27_COCPS|nr:aldo-keto reductase [Coccidioides posadasii str. Silveira]KMM68213.1 aldo-keto reductase [Coccidioides posadasii RMSCC 3488]QVM12205.1 hypothetical protein D8B26_006839 [Coccidioides posadasii str. Silveira]
MAATNLPAFLQESIKSTKVDYRKLGRSGLKVSVPILGAMSFGSTSWAPWVIEEDKALPLLKAAYDRGLNTWDTANVYSNGISEEIIAKAIEKYSIPREKLVIMTKCWAVVSEHDNVMAFGQNKVYARSKDYVNQLGLSRQAIFSAANASLKRLKTDYIDLLQIHRFDDETPIEETMEALHDLVKSGKVRYIGASSMCTYQFAMMQFCAEKRGWTKFISMQNKYNLLYREEEREMNRFCRETGVGLIPWSPLERGFLARPPSVEPVTPRAELYLKTNNLTEEDLEIIRRVEEISKKKGRKMSEIAIAWIKSRVTSPIIGFSSIERIDEALTAREVSLTEEEEKYLEEPYRPKKVVGHS